jgi:Leucine Rich repeat
MSLFTSRDVSLDASLKRSELVRRLVAISLLILVMAGGFYGFRVWRRFLDHLRAASRLETLGMRVEWQPIELQDGGTGGTRVDKFNGLPDGHLTDADLPLLRQLDHLSYLDLSGCTNVTDEGLKNLAGLSDLRELILGKVDSPAPKVTDAGLIVLESLPQLRFLSMPHTAVTDAGLAHLRQSRELELLDLDNSSITDAGLVHLRGLPRLRQLSLTGTKVTNRAVVALMQTIPGLEVAQGSPDVEDGK